MLSRDNHLLSPRQNLSPAILIFVFAVGLIINADEFARSCRPSTADRRSGCRPSCAEALDGDPPNEPSETVGDLKSAQSLTLMG